MKTILTLAMTTFVIIFGGCTTKEITPTNPNKTQSDGIIWGRAVYTGYGDPQDFDLGDFSGTIVELLGTSRTTTTNRHGDWSFGNLDSGTYSFRFTRPGHFDFQLDNIVSDGIDSMLAKYIVRDSQGYGFEYPRVDLLEIPPSVTVVDAAGTLTVRINEIKDSHTGAIIRRDTSLKDAIGRINTTVSSALQRTRELLPVQIMYQISESPLIERSEVPTDSMKLISTPIWRVLPEMQRTGSIMEIEFQISSSIIENVAIGRQYYLHAVPVWRDIVQYIAYDKFGHPATIAVGGRYRYGSVVSVPIQWQ